MSLPASDSPLDQLPAPLTIHERMGNLYVELALLRRYCAYLRQRENTGKKGTRHRRPKRFARGANKKAAWPAIFFRLFRWLRKRTRQDLFLALFAFGFIALLLSDIARNQLTLEKFLALTGTYLLGKGTGCKSQARAQVMQDGQKP
jgi:hypothetical protein